MAWYDRFRGFNSHPQLEGTHAVLSASNYHWDNDDDEKLVARLKAARAAARGTRLHAWAAEAILMKRRQPTEDSPDHDILCAYINDAIEYGMKPEQVLLGTEYAYGTADAIRFDPYADEAGYAGFLRVHDYKSGTSKASVKQLYFYAVFFCLEYGYRPFEIEGELRIYQGNEVQIYNLDQETLARMYDRTKNATRIAERELGELF